MTKKNSTRHPRVGLDESVRRKYEEDLIKTRQEIDYLAEIDHPRHKHMILQRKKHVAHLKRKLGYD